MSVLSCDRKGCPNIMCDRYSSTYGYICNSCFEELVASTPETQHDIEIFMGNKKNPMEASYSCEFCNYTFPVQYENDGE